MKRLTRAAYFWLNLCLLLTGTHLAANAGADLAISVTHTGSFVQGQTNAVYLIRVTNSGTATEGPVTVTDFAPAGLTVKAMRGIGWTCSANNCTYPVLVLSGQSYPAITVLVAVASSAPSSLTNQVTVSAPAFQITKTANDVTAITPPVSVVAWGADFHGESDVPSGLTNVTAIAAGSSYSLALTGDGTVVAWGDNAFDQSDVPSGLTGVTAISAGSNTSLALKSDGTVVAWGQGASVPPGLTDVVAIAAGREGAGDLALKGDGTVVAFNGNVPPPVDLANVIAIVASATTKPVCVLPGPVCNYVIAPFNYALKSDGTVAVWDHTGSYYPLPSLPRIVAITERFGLTTDGTVIDLFSDVDPTPGLTDVVAISAAAALGEFGIAMALRNDGTVIEWDPAAIMGVQTSQGYLPPIGLTNVTAVSTILNGNHFLALTYATAMQVKIGVGGDFPYGLVITIDGTPKTFASGSYWDSPISFMWATGSAHTLSSTSPQLVRTNISRDLFTSWSDGGAISHTVVAVTPTTYTANFQFQSWINMYAGRGGTISPPSGFYDDGAVIQVTANPDLAGCQFYDFQIDTNTPGYPYYSTANPLTYSVPKGDVHAFFTCPPDQPPATGSVIPSSRTGSGQIFTAVYTDADGVNDLAWAQILFAAAPNGGGQSYCFVTYDAKGNGLWLYGDQSFWIGPIAPGTTSNVLQNSLCAVNTQATTATKSGTTLTFSVSLVFKAAVTRNIYVRTLDTAGADTGLIQKGTSNLIAARFGTMSVSPNSGSSTNGAEQTFTLTYQDPSGFAGINAGWEQFLIGTSSTGGGNPYCFVHYDRAGNALWMYSDDVGHFVGPVTLGVASNLLDSSACSINTAGATATNTNGNLVLKVPITLKLPMTRGNSLFQRTLDLLDRATAWEQTGSWIVNLPPPI